MVPQEIIDRVRQLTDPLLENQGLELVEVEFRREARGWVLRLYVDKEGGVTLEDCAQISQEIGRNLDVEDFILSPYVLEVSSPGLTRPLRARKDFTKYRDRLIKVITTHPFEGRRYFKGMLRGVDETEIRIEVDGKEFQIPLSDIGRANLELDPSGESKPKPFRRGIVKG